MSRNVKVGIIQMANKLDTSQENIRRWIGTLRSKGHAVDNVPAQFLNQIQVGAIFNP